MTKNELITSVACKTGLTKAQSEMAVSAVIKTIVDTLSEGEKVSLIGFGTFEVRARAERIGTDPRTGEKRTFAATKTPVFKSGKNLKDSIKKV